MAEFVFPKMDGEFFKILETYSNEEENLQKIIKTTNDPKLNREAKVGMLRHDLDILIDNFKVQDVDVMFLIQYLIQAINNVYFDFNEETRDTTVQFVRIYTNARQAMISLERFTKEHPELIDNESLRDTLNKIAAILGNISKLESEHQDE